MSYFAIVQGQNERWLEKPKTPRESSKIISVNKQHSPLTVSNSYLDHENRFSVISSNTRRFVTDVLVFMILARKS